MPGAGIRVRGDLSPRDHGKVHGVEDSEVVP